MREKWIKHKDQRVLKRNPTRSSAEVSDYAAPCAGGCAWTLVTPTSGTAFSSSSALSAPGCSPYFSSVTLGIGISLNIKTVRRPAPEMPIMVCQMAFRLSAKARRTSKRRGSGRPLMSGMAA